MLMKNVRQLIVKYKMSTSEALSIIEVLVSGALIGSVLTALAVNMIYTQRMVEDIKSRSKAVDQVYACLAKFRAMRDMEANTWPYFCEKMISFTNQTRIGSEIKFKGQYYTDDHRIHKSSLTEVKVCDNIGDNTYMVNFLKSDGATLIDTVDKMKETCKWKRGTTRGSEGMYVRVIVKYKNAVGKERTVSAQEKFIRGGVDPEYMP